MIICTYKSRFNDGIFIFIFFSFAFVLSILSFALSPLFTFYALEESTRKNKSSATMVQFFFFFCTNIVVVVLFRSISNATGTHSTFT